MSSLNELISSGAVCRCLRSKTLFYQVEGSDAGAEGPFWCLHTQSLLGPDGKIVELESCRPGRSCCETV